VDIQKIINAGLFMTEFFYNSWFRYGFNGIEQQLRNHAHDKFHIEFEPQCGTDILPYREAVSYNNHMIKEKAGSNQILFMLSGGHDSTFAVKTMKEDGIDFTAITFDFTNNRNQFDVEQAIKLCKKYNIQQEIVRVDVHELFASGLYKEYARQTRSNSFYDFVYMHGIKDLNGFFVTGQGDQDFEFKNNKKYWVFGEQIFSLLNYATQHNYPGLVRYWSYTSTLFYSTYQHQWKKMTKDDDYFKFKDDFFVSLGMESKKKLHGLEWFYSDEFLPLRHSMYKYLITEYPTDDDNKLMIQTKLVPGNYVQIETPI
jgi:hypothetical protein